MAKGWLEFNPKWLGALFGLEATGRARVNMETGTVAIEVQSDKIQEEGTMLEGMATTYHHPVSIPSGWRAKAGEKRATAL